MKTNYTRWMLVVSFSLLSLQLFGQRSRGKAQQSAASVNTELEHIKLQIITQGRMVFYSVFALYRL